MSRLLKDFHRNLKNLSLASVDVTDPIVKVKAESHPNNKGQLGLKALQAPPPKSSNATPNIINQKSSVNSQNKGGGNKNAIININYKTTVNKGNVLPFNNSRKGSNSPNRRPIKRTSSTTSKKRYYLTKLFKISPKKVVPFQLCF